jgi:hypothetical protein
MTARKPLPVNWSHTPSGPPEASGDLASPHAGVDYFTTEADYRPLAERILLALSGGQDSFLVTSVPPPSLRLLTQTLRDATAGRYAVVGVTSGAEIVRAQLQHASPPATAASTPLAIPEKPPIVFVLGEADGLSDEQLAEIHEMILHGKRTIAATVLLASPGLVDRVDLPTLHMLRDDLAVHYRLQHVDREGVDPFLVPQVDPAVEVGTDDDPTLANDLTRRVLEFRTGREPAAPAPAPTVQSQPEEPPSLSDQLGEIARMLDEDLGELVAPSPPPAHPIDRLALREVLDELSYAVERAGREVIDQAAEGTIPPTGPTVPESPDPVTPQPESPVAVEAATAPAAAVVTPEAEATASPALVPVVFEPPTIADRTVEVVADPPPAIEPPRRPAIGWRIAVLATIVAGSVLAVGAFWTQRPASDKPTVAVAPIAATPPDLSRREAIPAPLPIETPTVEAKVAVTPPPATPKEAAAEPPAASVAIPAPAPDPAPPPAPVAAATPVVAPPPDVAAPDPMPQATPSPAPAVTSEPPPPSRLLPDEIAALIARGDAFLGVGDIVSARLFYERAAEAGDGPAALLVGETFDPALIARTGLRGVRGDAEKAAEWYRRAVALGAPEAEAMLKNLATH